MNQDTRLQHSGEDRERFLGSVAPPIFQSSLFTFPDCASFESAIRGASGRPVYSRVSNPTVRVLEEKLSDLERADDTIAFSSGMGAISAVLLSFLSSGDHLVCLSTAYVPALAFAKGLLRRMGVEVTFLEPSAVPHLEEHLRERTRLIYMESPSSLTFEVVDLEGVAAVARKRGVVTATDNSWATPLFHRPLELGIDVSLHSGTKYLAGHSDTLVGFVAGKTPHVEKVRQLAILLGASLAPGDAFLVTRGLRTLSLRMRRHEETAMGLARRLLLEERVEEVLHPALPFFSSHALWKRQFSGSSGLFSFRLRGDVRRFADALRLFRLGFSWGGYESLVLPHVLVHAAHPKSKVRPDVPDDLVRLSVGLEDLEDLWADLRRGFEAIAG
jgi:cystathionine beta-lyase